MSPNAHLLLVPIPGWGHIRPLLTLAARIVSQRQDVVVTVLTTSTNFDKSRFELERQFETGAPALQRIRLISIVHSPGSDVLTVMGLVDKSYPAAYETLVQSKPMTCATTGTLFEGISKPVAVIIDCLALGQLQATRSLTGSSVPIIDWVTGSGATLIRLWGPEFMGGLGNLGLRIDAEAARTNKTPLEVGEQLYRTTNGNVVKVPGVPPMYDHEFFAQPLPSELPFSLITRRAHDLLMDSDALLIASSDAYEQESLDAVRDWLSGLDKPVYAVGPIVPIGHASTRLDDNSSGTEVAAFLDDMLAKHGVNSMVFISFGSLLWPTNSEQIEEVVQALIEKNIPFVLSHASPHGKVSSELSQKIQSSGLGLLTPWAPQQFILNHPVTGWFLTHGGHGGTTESLTSGVPMICWPFWGDQPAAAAYLTEKLKVAFELFEVRTGENGLKPLYRNGLTPKGTREALGVEIRRVFDGCFDKEGEGMRRDAQRLRKEFIANWEEEGASRISLGKFLEKYA